MISLNCDIYDHEGNKLFSNKILDEKNQYVRLANNLAKLILDDIGQEKIDKLDELNDFDYAP